MAFHTKLNIVALVLILLSFHGAKWCTSASSLHQRDQQNSRWVSDCRIGYRKLGHLNCENADGFTNMKRSSWSQSLKTALSPPPAPVKRVTSRLGNAAPPPPNI
ncbi:hypothetical protein POM88_002880 [Heracleum sosnowskyi]|uniref:Uncharacterized protein n=1 Tax=Heracleum sosnowskyi TaxID=360622 RepID=A0AAD8N6D8_9APIA|nr:hypothetical protein POM88_002880 [Heracleum sosnowskyi]